MCHLPHVWCLNSKGSSIQGGTSGEDGEEDGKEDVSILKVVRFKGEHKNPKDDIRVQMGLNSKGSSIQGGTRTM